MLSARRVVCPKCSTILKEPQAQIYECSVCGTLLVAKGHPVGVPSNIVLHDGIDQNAEDILKDSIKEQSHKSAHSSNKYLSEIKFSSHSAELTPPLKQKDKTLQSESTTERLLHECGHRTSDNDSVSHSESDAYLDSPLWSSDNLNAHELLEVPSLETSPTALELVNSKHVSSVSSLDCGERVQQGNQSGENGDTLKDKNIGSEVIHMQSSPLYHHSAGTAHSKASGTMSDSLIGKETCIEERTK